MRLSLSFVCHECPEGKMQIQAKVVLHSIASSETKVTCYKVMMYTIVFIDYIVARSYSSTHFVILLEVKRLNMDPADISQL